MADYWQHSDNSAYRRSRFLQRTWEEAWWDSLDFLSKPVRDLPGCLDIGSKIVYLEALGKSIIVINDITIAEDLLEKRSALYSSRYVWQSFYIDYDSTLLADQQYRCWGMCLCIPYRLIKQRLIFCRVGLRNLFGLMPYGDEWRAHRRMFQQYYSQKNLPQIQERGIECIRKGLLPNLIESPDDFIYHVRKSGLT